MDWQRIISAAMIQSAPRTSSDIGLLPGFQTNRSPSALIRVPVAVYLRDNHSVDQRECSSLMFEEISRRDEIFLMMPMAATNLSHRVKPDWDRKAHSYSG